MNEAVELTEGRYNVRHLLILRNPQAVANFKANFDLTHNLNGNGEVLSEVVPIHNDSRSFESIPINGQAVFQVVPENEGARVHLLRVEDNGRTREDLADAFFANCIFSASLK